MKEMFFVDCFGGVGEVGTEGREPGRMEAGGGREKGEGGNRVRNGKPAFLFIRR